MAVLENPRHEAFAQGLASGKTADEAYIAAGYKPNRGNAARMKANESIASRVEEIVQAGADMATITVARVLQELARVGTSDVRRLFNEAGQLKPIDTLDDETAAAIASVEVVTKRTPGEDSEVEYVHKFRFWDKNSALEKLGKHLGMFTDKLEVTGKDGKDLVPEQSDTEIARRLAFLLTKGASQ